MLLKINKNLLFSAIQLALLCGLLRSPLQAQQQEGPAEKALLDRMIARSSQVARDNTIAKYTYEKRSRAEELNSRSEVTHSTEKTYQVVLVNGWPFSRLARIQGQQLSEAEIRREDQREQEFRNKVAGRDVNRMARNKEMLITSDLVSRFDFHIAGHELNRGRKTIILDFKAKRGNPEESIQDKIYNRLTGRVWVDDEDAEPAKLDVKLTEELSLGWLGMLGSVKDCRLNLIRRRMPDGVWVNEKQTLLIIGRKVFSTMRLRTIEESSNFQRQS